MRTPRGGQLTYHGPGQLVGYPIMHVASVPEYILTMETRDRRRARRRGRRGRARGSATSTSACGSGERKIASVGVHISHGVSSHGFAVNVDNDLDPFTLGRGLRAARGADDLAAAEGVAEGLACFRKRIGVPLQRGVRAPPAARQRRAARHRAAGRGVMDVGLAIFLTRRRASAPDVLAPAPPRTRGYESLLVTEHTHIPVSAGMVDARRRAARREVPPHARPVRGAGVRRRGDREADRRHERLPGDRARPDRAGQGDRLAATCSPAGASCSASARAGTSRRCATTAPTPRRATATCASASRP